ncbi:hypothetical protein [Halobacillus massiliensis]|uniref:hypothetical protein n=1 Tax=Halobacillus massiliensis TaxID=1926286 RepID=UPI0009E45B0C|nr:hypothetical protein [Halobacillus massiliensis]
MYIEKINNGKPNKYAIKQKQQNIGTFILEDKGNGVRWLRKLELDGSVSKTGILYVFELIQVFAKEEKVHELHVKSHSKELNTLLEYQKFHLRDQKEQLWVYTPGCGKVQ